MYKSLESTYHNCLQHLRMGPRRGEHWRLEGVGEGGK